MEEYITIETAQLLKKKGFHVKIYDYYCGDFPMSSINKSDHNNCKWGETEKVSYCSRPTQSVVQKWLRDEHNIHVSPKELWSRDKTYVFGFACTVNGSFIKTFDNHEDAFEDGLVISLNMLSDVS